MISESHGACYNTYAYITFYHPRHITADYSQFKVIFWVNLFKPWGVAWHFILGLDCDTIHLAGGFMYLFIYVKWKSLSFGCDESAVNSHSCWRLLTASNVSLLDTADYEDRLRMQQPLKSNNLVSDGKMFVEGIICTRICCSVGQRHYISAAVHSERRVGFHIVVIFLSDLLHFKSRKWKGRWKLY